MQCKIHEKLFSLPDNSFPFKFSLGFSDYEYYKLLHEGDIKCDVCMHTYNGRQAEIDKKSISSTWQWALIFLCCNVSFISSHSQQTHFSIALHELISCLLVHHFEIHSMENRHSGKFSVNNFPPLEKLFRLHIFNFHSISDTHRTSMYLSQSLSTFYPSPTP
jgi:hypothetical protein